MFRRFLKNKEGASASAAPNILPIATDSSYGLVGDSADPSTPAILEVFASDPDSDYPLTWNIPASSAAGNMIMDAGPGSLGNMSHYIYMFPSVPGPDSFTYTVTDALGGTSNVATVTYSNT